MKPINIKGKQYNRLTVLKRSNRRNQDGKSFWNCRCACGNTITCRMDSLKSGTTRSCGCLVREHAKKLGAAAKTHGLSYSAVYSVWEAMIARCNNKNNKAYKNYGGRGIKVCNLWLEFRNFFKDMGHPPLGLTLDRINSNGNYEPKNCRWADRYQQNSNTSRNVLITIDGKTACLSEWLRLYDINQSTYRRRISCGWETIRAIKERPWGRG